MTTLASSFLRPGSAAATRCAGGVLRALVALAVALVVATVLSAAAGIVLGGGLGEAPFAPRAEATATGAAATSGGAPTAAAPPARA